LRANRLLFEANRPGAWPRPLAKPGLNHAGMSGKLARQHPGMDVGPALLRIAQAAKGGFDRRAGGSTRIVDNPICAINRGLGGHCPVVRPRFPAVQRPTPGGAFSVFPAADDSGAGSVFLC
jgi:hypothetical protein